MKEFDELIEVSNRLNDPVKGCPWDIKQTFESLQKYILEEACELVDAIEDKDIPGMIEELGDLLYVVIFYCKVAEKDKVFSLEKVLDVLKEKLVRRHPHVFGQVSNLTPLEVEKQWKDIKKEEKKERKGALEGIPRSLSILAKTQKVLSKLIEHEYQDLKKLDHKHSIDEPQLGAKLLQLVLQAEKQGLDAEKLLRQALSSLEESFREWEKGN